MIFKDSKGKECEITSIRQDRDGSIVAEEGYYLSSPEDAPQWLLFHELNYISDSYSSDLAFHWHQYEDDSLYDLAAGK